jgi:hypothetical protein
VKAPISLIPNTLVSTYTSYTKSFSANNGYIVIVMSGYSPANNYSITSSTGDSPLINKTYTSWGIAILRVYNATTCGTITATRTLTGNTDYGSVFFALNVNTDNINFVDMQYTASNRNLYAKTDLQFANKYILISCVSCYESTLIGCCSNFDIYDNIVPVMVVENKHAIIRCLYSENTIKAYTGAFGYNGALPIHIVLQI